MATAGEDTAAAAAATAPTAAYEGGGAEGKFRKRPFRRALATPYDRPPTALRNPSWLSKLVVDPASKLINAGARRFFASFFRKALPSPPPPPPALPAIPAPPPPETTQDSRVVHQPSDPNYHAGDLESDVSKGGDAACNFEGNAFSELEQLLKQKTFTRSEIDRLTELLHSKAVDSHLGGAGKEIEVSKPASEDISRGLLGNYKTEKGTSHGVTSTAIISTKMPEDVVASPAELAKTYMGSRQSKVSRSMASCHSQTVREMVPFVSQSPVTYFAKKPSLFGASENGFTTPKSRGRSAVYNMARTPYSRVRPTDIQKGDSPTSYLYAGPSSSQSRLESGQVFGSRQESLKRRSSVLDDDLGSIGPIRRIRQKSNLLYNNSASLPTRRVGTVSVAPKHELSPAKDISRTLERNHDIATPSTSRFLVPTKSSETAAKILEHIDKLSSKEKTSESKRVMIKDKSPTKLTTNMLHGQALRSLERLDSSRLLQSSPNTRDTENLSRASLADAGDSNLPKLGNVEESKPVKFVDTVNHEANSEVAISGRDAPAPADSIYPKSVALPPEKKRAFKMSAFEDSFELDDDIESNGLASKPLSEGKGNQEMPLVNGSSVPSEEPSRNKTAAFPEINTPPGFLGGKTGEETPKFVNNGVKSAGLSTGVELQAAKFKNTYGTEIEGSSLTSFTGSKLENLSSPTNNASAPTGVNGKLEAPMVASSPTASLTSLSNGNFSPNPTFASTVLAASNTESHAITSITSEAAPSSSVSTSVSMTSSVFGPPVIKPGSSIFSSTTFSTPPTAPVLETPDSKVKSDNIENGTNLGNMKDSSFAGASSAATTSIFGLNSSVTPTSIATQPQGSLFSTGSDSIISTKPLLPQSASSTGPQTISSLFGSSTSSSLLGTSGVTSFSSRSATAPANNPSVQTSAESNKFGFSGTTPSSIFAFGATPTPSGTTTSALPSNGVTVTPSLPAETKVVTPSTGTTAPFRFGDSSSNADPAISSFGSSSGASASTSGTPIFSFCSLASSSSATNSGVFSFSGSSAASSSSNTAPVVFGFSGSSAVSSSSNTAPVVFGFSGSSAVSSSSNTAPVVFGFSGSSGVSSSSTTNPGIFSFSSTSGTNTSSSTTTPGIFSFGVTSAASSSSSVSPGVFGSVASNQTPGTYNFGASSSASSQASQGSSAAGIFGSSTPSIGFNFGTSSPSFSTTTNTTPLMPFGSSPLGASSGPVFGFGATSSSSQSIFGNATPTPAFQAPPGNNDQMSMEAMAEDHPVQSTAPVVPVFGQPSNSPAPNNFVFGSPNPFGVQQQNQPAPQNPFQASGSSEFGGGGSFSLGSSGPDKSGRRIIKPSRKPRRK